MGDRMSERAKGEVELVLDTLYKIAPEVNQVVVDCTRILRENIDAEGDFVSPKTVEALSEVRNAVGALYAAAHKAMAETDRFFGPSRN